MTFALLLASLVAYALAAIAGALLPDRLWSTAAAVAGGVCLSGLAVAIFAGGRLSVRFTAGPLLFPVHFGVPPLSALMLALIAPVGVLASVYGHAYVAHMARRKRATAMALLPLFIGSMALVVIAADLAAFLFAWEVMSLSSFALVMTDGERPEVVRAGYVYLVMTHVGTLCLTAAFLLLTGAAGSTEFGAWAAAAPHLPPALRSAVFVLAVLGFGGKAALVPLHVWLPRAHPVAPSHVSALMSGIMLKVAVYGLILFSTVILGRGPVWWGLLVLLLGIASSVLGVLYALMEHDLKRLLAYHSVENIGIIAIGLGVALLGISARLPLLATVAVAAALYHTINHALFKTALFLDAGSIDHAGAGRNLDRMGGLLRRMPWTAGSLLLTAAAISGLPPLNGFVSEWLTYQALVRLLVSTSPGLAVCAVAGVLALALTGGLAAACFIKVSGSALLGRPRTDRAAAAREARAAMYLPPAALAAACLALGLLPGAIARPLLAVAASTVRAAGPPSGAWSPAVLALPWAGATLGPGLFAAAALVLALLWSLSLAAGRRDRAAAALARPWNCGGDLDVQSQYSATSYAKPFRRVFGALYRPVRAVHIESSSHPFFRTRVAYEGEITPIFDRYVYGPGLRSLLTLARLARRLQSGSLRLYLGYMLVTLALLLAFVR